MTTPVKKVYIPADIEKWEMSEAYEDILGFITVMNEEVKGKKLSSDCFVSEISSGICNILEIIFGWIKEIPPIEQPQRYGNKAFKQFYEKLKDSCSMLLKGHLPKEFHSFIPEFAPYLTESLGNSTRIDYGTGHELSFIMFLCCLHKIGALKKEDSVATVTKLFKRYLDLARELQKVYKMEPAGSQGVWSLDDYQFIPFLWGSSQLIMNPKIAPEMFTNEKIVQEYSKEYIFLSCIEYVMSVKTGPFAEHSNQLWNISAVQSWNKINQGLFKMYKAEILHKYPIIQHVLFGSILSFDQAKKIIFHPASDSGSFKSSADSIRSGIGKGISTASSCSMSYSHNLVTSSAPHAIGMMPPLMSVKLPPMGVMPPPTEVMPPPTEVMPPPTEVMPPPTEVMPPPTKVMPPPTEVMPPPTEVMPPPTEVMPPPTEVMPPPTEVMPPPTEVMPPPTEVMPPPTEVMPPPTEVMPPPTEVMPNSEKKQYSNIINRSIEPK